ncbi:YphA family membrane protein [Bacillus solimangrovi]|uniref:Uncharacterized protein n=1 Tax=Bacillus solimangrovi TaxID=1305675 RepID=A0A1E5LHB7_9BACI|nr:hypothetical protein [Bacillus solimangrovi]OEH93470.1 hypothetical protein BFG57_00295 [Bacillus solimangrovi]
MEGLFFYWVSWIGWIIVTFFMNKSSTRTILSYGLLSCIALSNWKITVYSYEISGSYIVLLCFALGTSYYLSKLQNLYLMIMTLTVTAAFVAFHLFEMFDPIWIIAHRQWLLSGLMFILVWLMSDMFLQRVLSLVIGMCQGEWLYTMMLYRYSYYGTIGGLKFLDLLTAGLGFLFMLSLAEWMISSMKRYWTYSERQ